MSPITAKPMVLELLIATSRAWRRLKGTNQLPKVIAAVGYDGGIAKHAA